MRLFPGGRLFRVRLYSLERMCGFLARYIARRLGLMVLLLFGVSLMVFLISHLVPSDPVGANLSATAQNNPEVVAAFKAKWGLDKPLVQQYFIYVGNLLKGDMGNSIRTGRPVLEDLLQYFPATVELSVFAMLIAIVLGILFGVISAVFRNKPADQILRGVSVSGVSIPSFWFALLVLYVFSSLLGWFPSGGRLDPRAGAVTGGTGL